MAFYSVDADLQRHLEEGLQQLRAGRPQLLQRLSITWLVYDHSIIDAGANLDAAAFWRARPRGACHGATTPRYPASIVKLVYQAAVEAWIDRGWLRHDNELAQAMADMIRHSSNDATALVLDRLTATTSGPSLPPERFAGWQRQRQLVNDWLRELGWPELNDCNCCQKTWGDGPYGREAQSYGSPLGGRNALSSDGVARLLHGVIAGQLVSPLACCHMRQLLERPIDLEVRAADAENQVDGFLGQALPPDSRLWSKAGLMSTVRGDAAYMELPLQCPCLVVVLGEGQALARDEALLPALMGHLRQAL